MSVNSEFREYENGIADVLASVIGEAATVRRNIRLPSRSGKRKRQIDVLVEGDIFGLTNARMIVDCKRWKTALDAGDVDKFIGLVEDVNADMGLLVSAAGASEGAVGRAQAARGVRIKALSVDELNAWRPAGTVFGTFEIPESSIGGVSKALREAGLRVFVGETDDDNARIEVFRHYGTARPDGEAEQVLQHELTEATLKKLEVPYRRLSNGVTIDGGTPNHRWLPVHVGGTPLVRVLAATEADLEFQLSLLTTQLGIPAELLEVERPNGWPYASAFPF
jgi:Restriction endonuclease